MEFTWQPGFSLTRKPVKRKVVRRVKGGSARNSDKSQLYEFIVECPERSRSKSQLLKCTKPNRAEVLVGSTTDYHPSSLLRGISVLEHMFNNEAFVVSDGHNADSLVEQVEEGVREIYPFAESQLCDFSGFSNFLCDAIPRTVLYSSLLEQYTPVLHRYDTEFCKIPLTSELRINPFRCRTNLQPKLTFLVHAVMALAGHHVQSASTQAHRHTALQLLRKSLGTQHAVNDRLDMLDTIIVLFSLDETQSAVGSWTTHLLGAYGLLEACGGIETWITSPRIMVQVGILMWWDTITSLVSREDCVFPYAYFEALQSVYDGQNWDFFGLCGCPSSLVVIVMQLARLAVKKQKSSSLHCITFDNDEVSKIESLLESWHHRSLGVAFRDEESMQQDQDCMHCSEAWRNGLLLYVYRVFYWQAGCSIPIRILHRARIVMDHVFACRDESMVSRQALLPLFFAGCELKDRSARRKILEFCSTWDERTRYHMFNSAIPLLKDTWAEQETKGFENVWWGQIVDKQHSSQSSNPLRMRVCFG